MKDIIVPQYKICVDCKPFALCQGMPAVMQVWEGLKRHYRSTQPLTLFKHGGMVHVNHQPTKEVLWIQIV